MQDSNRKWYKKGRNCNMANKENYSVKDEIETALLALLSKKEYASITVMDLVKEAKVARVSFYRHFSSISDVLESIAEKTVQKLNIEFLPLMDTSDERKLRQFLFNYFYQVSLHHKEMWTVNAINHSMSTYLGSKFLKSYQAPDPSATMSEKYGWVAKLCLLDGIAKKWVFDGLQETPEEMIDYVMPVIRML